MVNYTSPDGMPKEPKYFKYVCKHCDYEKWLDPNQDVPYCCNEPMVIWDNEY